MPCIYVVNKIDHITLKESEILDKLPHYYPVSAHLEWNLDGLLEKIREYLNLTRIYTKPKGMNPDYDDPVILSSRKGQWRISVIEFTRTCLNNLNTTIVHCLGCKRETQAPEGGKEYELEDEDAVQIIKKF